MDDFLKSHKKRRHHFYLSVSLLDKVLASSLTDFEDAVQFNTAVYSEADYIITRNAKHFATDHIPVLSPTDFLVVGK